MYANDIYLIRSQNKSIEIQIFLLKYALKIDMNGKSYLIKLK